ncbi:MAG: hypothetical protein A3F33_00475 [Candidatus Woykebacteria bacterium RIFCSPHIGHO2_12_FULL_43_10]|uniref:Holliday junction resolvase-related domain-containing protein n=2 Tax=Candidatus Woykeibacteriota TaxID=1817899 RepID=A0A1G1WSQ9_9BACT|nr:MAG: hypothetical protein A2802_02530 [Candidatus Woykebacteria bacterium RIFCSPHIGHO2_01_FULL_43_29]OGY28324.1 MAG: hypothetical protein A3J50_02160 [Candidatus Woykebacteria bacterium RIFCSPHIGHO2_02_FULL_43_16b]OGY28887.1 MAG: hypothetical protein A3F33_00475 [Candidatus Woykebacteria bacterium RIFCSPHIGHO2_12_FULL_43_10]OGY30621.1 MAG: hypothetical protein A3A61_03405 [Candidatus Woykebacteria bacterium RIFCSPLOWO2_01_FULL_43_14]
MVQIELTTLVLILVLVILTSVVVYFIGRFQGAKRTNPADLPPNLLALYQEVQNLPAKILNTIQGSINPQKGKVGELLTYAELRYDYDVIIPLGQPVDFIGIKNGQKIDFIEVKSSSSKNSNGYSLTQEEKEIQKLVKQGAINFRLVIVKDSIFGENEN